MLENVIQDLVHLIWRDPMNSRRFSRRGNETWTVSDTNHWLGVFPRIFSLLKRYSVFLLHQQVVLSNAHVEANPLTTEEGKQKFQSEYTCSWLGRLFPPATVPTDRFPDPFHVHFAHRRPSFHAWVTLAKRSSTLSASFKPWAIWLYNSAHLAPVAKGKSAQPSRKEERVSERRTIQRRIRSSWIVRCAILEAPNAQRPHL